MIKSHLDEYEKKYQLQGYKLIAGIDEAGRGPLAGPVVAAAVIFPVGVYLPEINDSKQLSKKKREQLVEVIKQNALAIEVSVVDVEIIDKINILEAARLAMINAYHQLTTKPDFILTDAMDIKVDNHESIIKGDQKSVTIAAASIIAKTYRDKYMQKLDEQHPEYGFITNQGYGTKRHLEAINNYGIINQHRKTFEPIKTIIKIKGEI